MKKIIIAAGCFAFLAVLWGHAFSFAQTNRDPGQSEEVDWALWQEQESQAMETWDENFRDETWGQSPEDLFFETERLRAETAVNTASPVLSPISPILDILELKDMDIVDVLKLISKKSGLNIVAGANVRGKVTIYLKNVDVRDALRIILEANGLAFVEEDGIIKVLTGKDFETRYGYLFGQQTVTRMFRLYYTPVAEVAATLNQVKTPQGVVVADNNSNTIIITDRADRLVLMESFLNKADVPVITQTFVLHYAKAEDIAKKIESSLTQSIGKIEWDGRSNRLVVTDTRDKILKMVNMVQAFDIRQKAVAIEAKIIQIVLNDEFKLGVNWEAIVRDYHDLRLVSKFDLLEAGGKRGELGIGNIDSDGYEFLIEALRVIGDTETLSSPRITVINNEEAKILIGLTTPYITQEIVTTAAGPITTSETVNFIDTGVKLYVTPTIHEDGYITMKIRPEVSSVIEYVVTSENNKIPIVDTSQAETTVMARDGVTIVIGGLIKDEKRDSVRKVPLLGDIPFLGALFRSQSTATNKTELVIFLTPKIVTGSVSADERQEVKLRSQNP